MSPFFEYYSSTFLVYWMITITPVMVREDNSVPVEIGTLTHVVYVSSKYGTCSGSLITHDLVLTVAHCLVDRHGGTSHRVGPTEVKLLVGVVDVLKSDPKHLQERHSSQVIIHPEFRYGKLSSNDIALIRADTPFKYTDTVFHVDIEDKGWPQDVENRTCTCSGWGSVADQTQIRLRMWDVIALHGQMSCPCTKPFQWKRLVCAQFQEQSPQMCSGDAGGALICDDKVVAIAHMTRERFTCDHLGYPSCEKRRASLSAFMFICPYNDWIRSHAPQEPPTPQSCLASEQMTTCALIVICFFLSRLLGTR